MLPDAHLVIDRFQVAEDYRESLDKLRQTGLRLLKQDLLKEDYATLKGSTWAIRKSPEDLTIQDRQVLKQIFGYSSQVKQAYHLQQQLTILFDRPLSKASAKRSLRAWIKRVQKRGLTCFDPVLLTLETWWVAILGFFITSSNSSFVERLINKLKCSNNVVTACSVASIGICASPWTWKAAVGSALTDPISVPPRQFLESY